MADVVSAQAGDPGAFSRLSARHHREIHHLCRRILGSGPDAEDAAQEAMLAAWRGLPGFHGRSSFRTWLFRVATNTCLDIKSRRARTRQVEALGPPLLDGQEPAGNPTNAWPPASSDAADPDEAYSRREDVVAAFAAVLLHLPASQRRVLVLREVVGLTAAETAATLGTTPASVNSALQRARAAITTRIPSCPDHQRTRAVAAAVPRAVAEALATACATADVPALLQLMAERPAPEQRTTLR